MFTVVFTPRQDPQTGEDVFHLVHCLAYGTTQRAGDIRKRHPR